MSKAELFNFQDKVRVTGDTRGSEHPFEVGFEGYIVRYSPIWDEWLVSTHLPKTPDKPWCARAGEEVMWVAPIDLELVTPAEPDLSALAQREKELLKPATEDMLVQEATEDVVNHPSHYKRGGLEAIDVMEAFNLHRDGRLFNAGKYILRAGEKDLESQEIRKAIWYLERYASDLEGQGR